MRTAMGVALTAVLVGASTTIIWWADRNLSRVGFRVAAFAVVAVALVAVVIESS